ncbi:hypothetical protein [Flindersiella endophytica]
MRASKAALLWVLSVAAVLLTPLAGAPAPAAAATFAHRTGASSTISLAGQHATRHGPASSPSSGVPDSQPANITAKLVVSGGPSSSTPHGDSPPHSVAGPAALRNGQASAHLTGPRAGVDPGARPGRSPPATHRA